MSDFSVAALFYGDHPRLARRCLDSLRPVLRRPVVGDVHLCANAVSMATWGLVAEFARELQARRVPVVCHVAGQNARKYPMLRHVLFGPRPPLSANFMWFDDDSLVANNATDLFDAVTPGLRDCPIAGQKKSIRLIASQANWLNTQPWAKLPSGYWTPGRRVTFPAGGWWSARMSFLREHQWPHPLLNHRGGDVMLGVLLEAQRLEIYEPQPLPVWINAQEPGQHHSQPRRGVNHPPLGYVLPPPPVAEVPIKSFYWEEQYDCARSSG